MSKKIREFIGEKVTYKDVKIVQDKDSSTLLHLGGFTRVSALFNTYEEADIFHDSVGEWIAEAINEKLKKRKK